MAAGFKTCRRGVPRVPSSDHGGGRHCCGRTACRREQNQRTPRLGLSRKSRSARAFWIATEISWINDSRCPDVLGRYLVHAHRSVWLPHLRSTEHHVRRHTIAPRLLSYLSPLSTNHRCSSSRWRHPCRTLLELLIRRGLYCFSWFTSSLMVPESLLPNGP